jgi:hypothetical protein
VTTCPPLAAMLPLSWARSSRTGAGRSDPMTSSGA